jgi:hypothetical protein
MFIMDPFVDVPCVNACVTIARMIVFTHLRKCFQRPSKEIMKGHALQAPSVRRKRHFAC